jgi:hypothetical protein
MKKYKVYDGFDYYFWELAIVKEWGNMAFTQTPPLKYPYKIAYEVNIKNNNPVLEYNFESENSE